MKTYRDFLLEDKENLEERMFGGQNAGKLQSLWQKFLSDAEALGYVPKPSDEIHFRLADASPHDAAARVALKTPSKRDMGGGRVKNVKRAMGKDDDTQTPIQKRKIFT